MMPRRLMLLLALLLVVSRIQADELPKVKKVELQPLAAQAKRVADALEFLGVPLADADRKALAAASDAIAVQDVLDKYCLAGVRITDEKTMQTVAGPAKPE